MGIPILDALLAITGGSAGATTTGGQIATIPSGRAEDNTIRALLPSRANYMIKPKWHAPWKLYRVISGHTGWVRAVDVEPDNQWFATGGADRIIKVFMITMNFLKLSF